MHTWAGVITSLIVYVMFALGSVVLFYDPLTVWEEPLLQAPAPALASLDAPLALVESLPEDFYYYLPHDGFGPPKIGYFLPGTSDWRKWWLDVEHGRLVPQRELAAGYLYDLHYLWYNATGYWLQYGAGVLVFGFLSAIVTGVLIHLASLLRQLNRFRPERGARAVWSDLHKVAGVFGLPFQLVYALTGTLMALSPLLFQLSLGPVFGGDVARAMEVAGPLIDDPPPLDYGAIVTPISFERAAASARAAEPRLMIESFVARGYPRERGSIDVRGMLAGEPFGDALVRVRLRDGVVQEVSTPDRERSVGAVARFIHGLHTVEYGGMPARVLMLLLALGTCATIVTGNLIWLERRRREQTGLGHLLLARLTSGVGAGTPVAVAALLLASRLSPLDAPTHMRDELLAMLVAFAASIAVALSTRHTGRTWAGLLGCAALLLAALPLVATSHSQAGLLGGGPTIETVRAVECGFLCASALLLVSALGIGIAARKAAQR